MLVGIDWQLRGHRAGMRTHMLVALGAAVMTINAFELYNAFAGAPSGHCGGRLSRRRC